MKRKLIIICLILILVVGCKNNNSAVTQEMTNTTTTICKSNTPLDSFMSESNESIPYKAKYSIDEGYATKDVELKISKMSDLENGSIFQLTLNQDEDIPEERFPMFLFVQQNRIYRLWKSADEIAKAEAAEDLIRDSTIIYQNETTTDDLAEGQEGIHHYISVESGKIESHFFQLNDYENVVGYFETFVWEDEWGLAVYRSGFSAEADLLELKRLKGK
ncbi:hypothetical protein ADH76_31585 [Enterocloster clostridioformis]|uniref:hypothetical protein n=1 Tax=Enterocloster clostridioformis TaxID=1531 RepID=UPI00080C685A|nr:hypothetical protein [Enterocloster clostridioformis]ANU46790.1 hypothetical protein A4V08_14205 [Lachnoclostridium sp. YL32]NDO26861.1 hypothetical protein [Enterocloster clostridioformis]OXE62381.1 hypothetical protein ADH76_31585 [Enterocloster clostridioformis]QQQ98505.1 hypothetical protein I5Q83_20395 [Enterocloster clostridioformis]